MISLNSFPDGLIVLQLAIETPVQHVKRKLVKPRVILVGSNEGEEKKKKKVRIRDKNSGRISPPTYQLKLKVCICETDKRLIQCISYVMWFLCPLSLVLICSLPCCITCIKTLSVNTLVCQLSELAIQMWVGKDCDRRKKDVMDLDIIMHNIMETLNKCR